MDIQERVVNELIEWIEMNIHNTIHISDVVKKSGYSTWHMQRMFKESMQQSLGAYIRVRKMIRAANDLILTRNTVLQIALDYGFNDQQSFTRVFKRHYNCPPGRWRRNMHDKMIKS